MKARKKVKTDWEKAGNASSDNNFLDELTTQNITMRVENKSFDVENPAMQIFKKNGKDCVRIEIQRDLYNQIVELKRKSNSRLSVPGFIQTILRDILKNNTP